MVPVSPDTLSKSILNRSIGLFGTPFERPGGAHPCVIVTETFLPKMDGIVRMLSELLAYRRYWLAYEKYDRRRAGVRALPPHLTRQGRERRVASTAGHHRRRHR
jgi:hypothetical protein